MWRQALNRSLGWRWQGNKFASAVSGERISLHNVKLRPRKGVIRRAVAFGFTAAVCFKIWGFVAFLPLKNLDLNNIPDTEDEEDLEPVFFPFPFTVKQIQPLPYAGAEEDWQGFVKFNKNDQLRQRVKDDLSILVRRAAEKNPLTKKWAKDEKDFQLGPSWLIISFPERPPPEFTRWGLEWNDTGLVIKRQKVDSRTKALLDRVLMPYPVASASYAFAKAMVKQNVERVTKYLGYSPGGKELSTTSLDPEIAKALKTLEARQVAGGSTASSSSAHGSSPSSSESDGLPRQKASDADAADASKEANTPVAKDIIPYYSSLIDKGSGPWKAFRERYKRTWKPLRYYPPRGSLAVHGMVALDSPKGRVFIDVFAWYHPKTGQFHQDSLTMNLRSISPYNQKPRR